MGEVMTLIILAVLINYKEKPVGQRVKVYDDSALRAERGMNK